MGNELLCSKQQEIVPDFQFNTPEQNINSKIEESLNDQDELNIIEAIKTNKTNNNNIEQINTKSIIIQNDEVMYERFDTKKNETNQNNFFYNSKEGPQDNIKENEKEKNDDILDEYLTEKNKENDIPLDSNEINKEKEKENKYTNLIIDSNKIIFSCIAEINQEENDDIDNKENNNENIVTNEIKVIIDKNETIEKRIQDSVDNSKKIEFDYYYNNNNKINYNQNENKLEENNNINNNFETPINIENNNKTENINYQEENNIISQRYESYENNDNINIENILPKKEFNQIEIQNYPNTQIINNNLNSELNLNENPTFFPKVNNNANIINENTNIYNTDYISKVTKNNNLIQNTEQIYQNNIVETYDNKLTNSNLFQNSKITNIISSNNNYQNNEENNKTYLTNNNYNYTYNLNNKEKPLFTDKEIDDMIKQAEKTNYQNISANNKNKVTYQQNNNNNKINQFYNNLILTPENNKTYYPLTPDYQTNKKRNDIIYYDLNSYFNNNNNKTIRNKNNINTNYASKNNQQKTTYNYNPINYNYDYNTQKKSNGTTIQCLYSSPSQKKANVKYILTPPKTQIVYKNPPKVNQQPLTQYKTQIIENSKIKYDYNITSNPKRIEHNSSIINQSYLKTIEDMNQKNYNVNSISSLYSDITNLNSSFISSNSKSPKKFDKFGNPIYFTSISGSNKKLKEYQNSQILRRNNYHKSFSYDDIRGSTNKFSDDLSSNKSPISSLYKNQNIIYNINSINSKNSIKSYINMKQSSIYPNQSNSNMRNMSIITSNSENIFLDIDESTKQIINKYITTDISSTSNYFPDNYKLFYPSHSDIFKIPEPIAKKQIKYYINNDPSKIAIYNGGINNLNQRHGLGQLKEPERIKIGTWKNNEFNGWGRIIYNNGQVLEGKYYKGKLNGKGVYKYKDVLYIGDFRDNIREGKGVLLNNKFRYNGQFNMGKIDGYGKIVFLENKEGIGEYEGFFKNNNIEGKGIMKWKNGNIYEGDMKNGKMNGFGKFIPYQGFPIEGIFRNNVKVNVKK